MVGVGYCTWETDLIPDNQITFTLWFVLCKGQQSQGT